MEAYLGRRLIAIVCLAALIGAAGCVSAPKPEGSSSSASSPPSAGGPSDGTYGPVALPEHPAGGPDTGYGPPLPVGVAAPVAPTATPATPAEQSAYGPERIQYKPILLVLGPGLARGFAHVGVIRALHAAKIPIAGIIGTEMGALVASIYAFDPNMNHFEWSLQRFKDDEFGTGQGFLAKVLDGGDAGRGFEDDLEKIFGGKNIQACKIPIRIGLMISGRAQSLYVGEGSLTQAVRATMAAPGLLSAGKWSGAPAFAATRVEPFGIPQARQLAPGSSVVVIDVSVPGQVSREDLSELKDADLVIRPDLHGIGAGDFSKRTDAAFRGKSAVEKQMKEIRHLVGLPENTNLDNEASP